MRLTDWDSFSLCPKKALVSFILCALMIFGVAVTVSANGTLSPPLTQKRLAQPPTLPPQVQIAIIIDDIGYSWRQGADAAALPGPVTLAIIPHSPHGAKLARAGHQQGKEIMLHVPMSNVLDKPLDAGALTEDMPYAMFMRTLHENLKAVPHVRGINNHMGSKLTQLKQPMRWLMETIKDQHLYFVDSRTSPHSVAWKTARETHVPTLQRDYFLDNDVDLASIAFQFGRFLQMAKRNGQGVAIAHPHPETIQVLRTAIPLLERSGVRLVPVSDLLSTEDNPQTLIHMPSNTSIDGPQDYKSPFFTR
ncbi:divergent polysaccharide deacetylase family protein [Aurantivibrio plasticivorans]